MTVLALTGAALAIACEFVYLDDIFAVELERINTVFKVYYFIWTVWSLAAVMAWSKLCASAAAAAGNGEDGWSELSGLGELSGEIEVQSSPRLRVSASPRPPTASPSSSSSSSCSSSPCLSFSGSPNRRRRLILGARPLSTIAAWTAFAAVFLVAMLYPLAGLGVRAQLPRAGAPADAAGAWLRRQFELDGAYAARRFGLTEGDYRLCLWLRRNLRFQTPVCEAAGAAYSAAGRIATFAGTCAPMAWDQHLTAWSGPRLQPFLNQRAELVRRLYTGGDTLWALIELQELGCRYVVAGELERTTYGDAGNDALARLATPVFQYDRSAIYAMDELIAGAMKGE